MRSVSKRKRIRLRNWNRERTKKKRMNRCPRQRRPHSANLVWGQGIVVLEPIRNTTVG